jgi:hypothetical protein
MVVQYEVTEIFVTTITLNIATVLFYFFQTIHRFCTIKGITGLTFLERPFDFIVPQFHSSHKSVTARNCPSKIKSYVSVEPFVQDSVVFIFCSVHLNTLQVLWFVYAEIESFVNENIVQANM